MVRVLFTLAALAVAVVANPFFHHVDVVDLIEESGEGNAAIQNAGAPEQWFTAQKVDHNDASKSKVWSQRYFTNSEFYGGPDSPVFIYINGEWVARNTTVTSITMFMNVLAKKHNALVVALEHRFYGKSQPMPDFTTHSLKLLSSEQAISDLVHILDHLTTSLNLVNSKWVAFGGSYAGMLAVWAKLKHPTRFAGALSSSGPIETKVDFHEFAEKAEFGLRYFGGDKCVASVSESLVAFHNLIASSKPEDVAELNRLFKPCKPFANDDDRMTLQSWTALEKVADLAKKQIGNSPCINIDYKAVWIHSTLTNPAVTTTGINRQWTYQTCTEFGFGQSAASSKSIFSALAYQTVDKAFTEVCRQGLNITAAETSAGVAANRKKYGALKIDVDNVVFPTGSIDGWAPLAPSNETGVVNPKSEVVDIIGLSHCGDMRAPTANDSGHLVWGHQRFAAAIDRFLRDQC